ncbi:MAG: sensor histidine kinase, partial [Lacisediminihabitans sp.]
PQWRTLGALAALWIFVLAWFTIGARACYRPMPTAIFIALVIVCTGAGTAFSPSLATMQAISYPLVWVFVARMRNAIIANVLLALAVGGGFLISLGTSEAALTQIIVTLALSLGFSMAMGLWISRVFDLSTERQELIERLQAAQGQLESLHRDAGATAERERLAREIHDTIAQRLTGIVLLAQRAQGEFASGGAALGDQLALLESGARDALAETRSLVAATASANLVDGGVAAALERLGERFTRETEVKVTVTITGTAAMDRDAEVVVLRCAQEGLANVRKHARARTASVTLKVTGSTASLTVADDGVGFDTSAASSGFGLAGLHERLTLVGGSLAMTSRATGTSLVATLPLAGQSVPFDSPRERNDATAAEPRAVAEPGATPPVPNDSKNRSAVPAGIEAPTSVGKLKKRSEVTP